MTQFTEDIMPDMDGSNMLNGKWCNAEMRVSIESARSEFVLLDFTNLPGWPSPWWGLKVLPKCAC